MASKSVGSAFHCEACGADSVLKSKPRMDGWTVLGEDLVCALCGAVVESDAEAESVNGAEAQVDEKLSALADFFSEEIPEKRVLAAEETRFCKDCKHFLRHPFVCRCLFHDRDTEPMKDCSDFERVVNDAEDNDTSVDEEKE